MKRHLTLIGLVVATCCVMAQSATAQTTNLSDQCVEPQDRMDKFRYLRALSLDLRGTVPTPQEYQALQKLDDVPGSWIDNWLNQPEFATRAVRWHKSLLWNNISNELLFTVPSRIRTTGDVYWRPSTIAIRQRGANTFCGNQPAQFNQDGELRLPRDENGWIREGWVEVEPYWAPGTKIKVCALDARDNVLSESGQPCGQRTTTSDTSCGCGPNLKWCASTFARQTIKQSMNEQIDRMIVANVLQNRSYLDLFTTTKTFINGPLAYYWTHQTGAGANIRNQPAQLNTEQFPAELGWQDTSKWVEIPAGEQHAGILTQPAYLIRFQTNRARANQFFTQFMCQPFQPPGGGLALDDGSNEELDLQKRDGCKYCHAMLEPAAAYWGRWPENSAGYLEPQNYPAQSQDCKICAETGRQCSTECRTHYNLDTSSDKMASYAGYLNAYLFRSQDHFVNVESGPKLLARSAVADNRMPNCVTKRNMEHYFGRALSTEEQKHINKLVQHFAKNDYSYTALVKAIVTSETYRRVR